MQWILLEAVEDGVDDIQEWYGEDSHITFNQNKTFQHFYPKENKAYSGA